MLSGNSEEAVAKRRIKLEPLMKKLAKLPRVPWEFWAFLRCWEHETGMIATSQVRTRASVSEGKGKGASSVSHLLATAGAAGSSGSAAAKKQRQRRFVLFYIFILSYN